MIGVWSMHQRAEQPGTCDAVSLLNCYIIRPNELPGYSRETGFVSQYRLLVLPCSDYPLSTWRLYFGNVIIVTIVKHFQKIMKSGDRRDEFRHGFAESLFPQCDTVV